MDKKEWRKPALKYYGDARVLTAGGPKWKCLGGSDDFGTTIYTVDPSAVCS